MSTAPSAERVWMSSAVVLDLDVEIVAEDLVNQIGDVAGLVHLIEQDEIAELARRAARQADDALAVGFEHLLVDARNVVVAFEVGDRRHLDEVLEAVEILGEQRQVIARLAAFLRGAIGATASARRRLRSRRSGLMPASLHSL